MGFENKSDSSVQNDDEDLDPDSDKIGLWYQEQWLVLPQLQSGGLTSSCWRGGHDNGDDDDEDDDYNGDDDNDNGDDDNYNGNDDDDDYNGDDDLHTAAGPIQKLAGSR